jgi:hypothetical protein
VTCECTTTLCVPHQQSFDAILADIPDRLGTMAVTISKQSVMGGQGGRPVNDDDRPLPVNLGAAEANHSLRAELVTLTVRVQHCLGEQPRDRTMHGVTAWLRALMPRIAKHPEALQWYDNLSRSYERTTKAIDIAPERVRAGKCDGCGAVLYVSQDKHTVHCKPCDTAHDVTALQDATLERLRTYTDTAANVVRALNAARVPLKLRKLTYWADRGVVQTVEDERGRIYRVGDVLDAMEVSA